MRRKTIEHSILFLLMFVVIIYSTTVLQVIGEETPNLDILSEEPLPEPLPELLPEPLPPESPPLNEPPPPEQPTLLLHYPDVPILTILTNEELTILEHNQHKLPFFKEVLNNYHNTQEQQALILYERPKREDKKTPEVIYHQEYYTIEELLQTLEEPTLRLIEPERTINLEGTFHYANHFNIPPYWDTTTGRKTTTCIIDSGINSTQIQPQQSISYFDDHEDYDQHGSIIADILTNLAPNTTIYSAKAFENNQGNLSNILNALTWCRNESDIILLPFGSYYHSTILQKLLEDIYDDNILLVGAAGNDGNTSIMYPAAYTTVIAVGSINDNNETSSFSNTGPELEFVTYGELDEGTGTSFAVPQLGALAALIKSHNQTITNNQLRAHVRHYAQDLEDEGKDDTTGYGIPQLNLTYTDTSYEDMPEPTYDCEEEDCTPTKEQGNYTLLSYLDGRTTITLNYANGKLVCNEVQEDHQNTVYDDRTPTVYDCDDSDECDTDEESEAYLRFDAGINLNNIILHSATLKVRVEGDEGTYDDGEVRIYSSQSYNPNTLTWNNKPSSNGWIMYDNVEDNEQITLQTTNLESIKLGFSGQYAYYRGFGDADGDDELEADIDCGESDTELTITYQECSATEGACCDSTNHFKTAGTICQAAFSQQCVSAGPNGCDGIAFERRCTGSSAVCSENQNYQISYPSACTGTLCVGNTCQGNQQTAPRYCQANTCEQASTVTCNNYLTCGTTTCKTSCTTNTDCITGYVCNQEKSMCIKEDAGNVRTLEYDALGNLVDDEQYNYSYNANNQLVNITKGNNLIASYVYDNNGKRVKKQEGNTTTYYVSNSIIITNASGTYNTTNYWYNNQLLATDNGEETLYYHNDLINSPVLITDEEGKPVERITYQPFGYAESSQRYQFTGYEKDPETNYLYASSRYYNSKIGKYNQPDNLLPDVYDPQQLNRYAYARNNPYKYTDPNGHFIDTIVDVGFIIWDIVQIVKDPHNKANWAALGGDALGAIIPGVTGVGTGVKAAMAVGIGVKTVKSIDKATDAAKAINHVVDAKKAVSNIKGLQHGYDSHALQLGLKEFTGKAWKTEKKAWEQLNLQIIENPDKTFKHVLGGKEVTGYYKNIDGKDIATYIYNEGPYKDGIATTVKLTSEQIKKFKLN